MRLATWSWIACVISIVSGEVIRHTVDDAWSFVPLMIQIGFTVGLIIGRHHVRK